MRQKQRALFQLARAVPTTTWSAADPMTLRPRFKSVLFLLVGLWIFGMGHASLIVSGLGVSPWTTLAQGVSAQTGWSIGACVLVVGILVLTIWIPLRERPGMGTIATSSWSQLRSTSLYRCFHSQPASLWQWRRVYWAFFYWLLAVLCTSQPTLVQVLVTG